MTDNIFKAFDAMSKDNFGDAATYFHKVQDKYPDALKNCDKDVTDPCQEWQKHMHDMVDTIGWDEMEKRIYKDNEDELDADWKDEMKQWQMGVFFNAGMFQGRFDKIFWDAFNHPH